MPWIPPTDSAEEAKKKAAKGRPASPARRSASASAATFKLPRDHPQRRLIDFCCGLPHAKADIKWGKDLTITIAGKIFVCFDLEQGRQLSVKTRPEKFRRLVERPGIAPAPYVGRFHWVAITTPGALPDDMLRELLRESYDLVVAGLPGKARQALS